jgi:hypothetical protein
MFVDGVEVGESQAPNMAGRRIDTIRYGNVAMAPECSARSEVFFDRVTLTDRLVGPLAPQG